MSGVKLKNIQSFMDQGVKLHQISNSHSSASTQKIKRTECWPLLIGVKHTLIFKISTGSARQKGRSSEEFEESKAGETMRTMLRVDFN